MIFRGYLPRDQALAAVKEQKASSRQRSANQQGPATILEAYACGVPVIAPDLGPIDEVVDDGRTGLLFRAGDTTDLAHKIERALASDDDLENMGRAARAKYESRIYRGKELQKADGDL